MLEPDRTRLVHMYDAARMAYGFVRGKGRTELDENVAVTLALVKLVEIIGEAASRVSEECRSGYPEIRWEDIIGMRHRLIHAYYDINRDILWRTVTEDIPGLCRQLERALGRPAAD